jgi:hypothetical protein
MIAAVHRSSRPEVLRVSVKTPPGPATASAAALATTGSGARGGLPDDDAVQALLPQVAGAVPLD